MPNETAQATSKESVPRNHDAVKWPDLVAAPVEEEYLIKNLIRTEDQVVLAGPPKAGKSYLTAELCMNLATGKGFFLSEELKITRKARVLYFSFEMGRNVVAHRIKVLQSDLKIPSDPDAVFTHVFHVNGENSFNIVQIEFSKLGAPFASTQLSKEAEDIRAVIQEIRPDFVVFDTFMRLHKVDENNNPIMAAVLKNLRKICSLDQSGTAPEGQPLKPRPIAHMIVHHTRKETMGFSRGKPNPDSVRGAGSILAEADLIITMARDGDAVQFDFTTRHVEPPKGDFRFQHKRGTFTKAPRINKRHEQKIRVAKAIWTVLKPTQGPKAEAVTKDDLLRKISEQLGDAAPKMSWDSFRKGYLAYIDPVIDRPKGRGTRDSALKLKSDCTEPEFFRQLGVSSKP